MTLRFLASLFFFCITAEQKVLQTTLGCEKGHVTILEEDPSHTQGKDE